MSPSSASEGSPPIALCAASSGLAPSLGPAAAEQPPDRIEQAGLRLELRICRQLQLVRPRAAGSQPTGSAASGFRWSHRRCRNSTAPTDWSSTTLARRGSTSTVDVAVYSVVADTTVDQRQRRAGPGRKHGHACQRRRRMRPISRRSTVGYCQPSAAAADRFVGRSHRAGQNCAVTFIPTWCLS